MTATACHRPQPLPGFEHYQRQRRPNHGMPDCRRFPLSPLAEACGISLLDTRAYTGNQHWPLRDAGGRELAARLGVSQRTITRWRANGIPRAGRVHGRVVDLPDHLACTKAGRHPLTIWADW